jgi:16S rRNA G966 N2-methylase RsmD
MQSGLERNTVLDLLAKYFKVVQRERLYSSANNLKFYLQYLFGDISFRSRRMLDIGGGSGIFSYYAACMGASEVICLEPEMEGFPLLADQKHERLRSGLQEIPNVTRLSTDIQHFEEYDPRFDIILLHNSINHLEEESCIRLHEDQKARETYHALFLKIGRMCNDFFHLLRIRNPLAWHIRWHKHQPPELWIQLLRQAGFSNPSLQWRSFDQLRTPGRLLTGNRLAAYFLQSHFRLIMDKNEP